MRVLENKRCRQSSRPPFGRIQLQVWSLVRRENPLRSYSFSQVVFALFKQRFPEFSCGDLAAMVESKGRGAVCVSLISENRCKEPFRETAYLHMLRRAEYNVQILSAVDIFVRASQLARIAGIQFTEVMWCRNCGNCDHRNDLGVNTWFSVSSGVDAVSPPA